MIIAFEGLLCAAFPGAMRRAMYEAAHLPSHLVRGVGLGAAVLGVIALWLIKGA